MKATNRFANWQAEKQVRREQIIVEYLEFLGKTHVKVRNPTDLAKLVAQHITAVESKPCSQSTLLRNLRYKAHILSYQARNRSDGSKALSMRNITDPTAKVFVARAQLESENLKREQERLRIYIKTLEDRLGGRVDQEKPKPSTQDETYLPDVEYRFVRTCQALRSVLSRLNTIVQVDKEKCEIVDNAARRPEARVIVDRDVAEPFFDWLFKQGSS